MSIKIEKLSKFYGTQQALKEVSIEVKKGEIVGFLGPNGAGKSTLMKILMGYLPFDGGKVFVNDFDVEKQATKLRQTIGYLPEHNPLYLELYVREYLSFNASIYKVPKSRVEEVIEQTGLTPEVHKQIGTLSKGYRQRVGLAAALLHNPQVLILDEPTTGLDPNQLVEIRGLIKRIAQDKTIFLSTHIMQEVEAICDRVIMIKQGEIVADMPLSSITQDAQKQIIEVEFDFKVEREFILKLQHLVEAENIHDTQWLLSFDATDDMRSQLFDFAQEMGVKILSMQRKNKKLEALFIEKTS